MENQNNIIVEKIKKIILSYNKMLREKNKSVNLYRGQSEVLVLINNNEGITLRDIKNHFGTTPATVSKTIHRLEKNGFIVKVKDAKDKRVSKVYLTEKGLSIISYSENMLREVNENIVKNFSDEEIDQLSNYLKRILLNIKNYREGNKGVID